MLQTYTFNDSGRQIDAQGDFLIFDSADYQSAEIEVLLDGVNAGRFKPGDSLELPTTVKRWQIVNVGGGNGAVRIGSGRLKRSGSVSVQGSVSVANIAAPVQLRERGAQKTMSGQHAPLSFMMAANRPGKAKQVHIINTLASLGAIRYLSIRPTVQTFISVSSVKNFDSAALTLPFKLHTGGGYDTVREFRPGPGLGFQAFDIWESDNPFLPPNGMTPYLFGQLVNANQVFEFPLDRFPVVAQLNAGILVQLTTTDCAAQFNVVTDSNADN